SFLLFRHHDSRVRGFYNVCRHRGSRLCQSGAGTLPRAICCPYHGWTYDLEGRLIEAPHMEGVAGFDPADYGLKPVAAETWEAFLFVNLASDPVPLHETFAPLADRLRDWRLGELISVRQVVYDVRANWKLIFQNYNECYHCPRVHPRLNALTPFTSARNSLMSGPILGGPMMLAEGIETMSTGGRMCGPPLPGLGDADRRSVYYYSVFPTMFLSPHPDYVLVHRIERRGVSDTRVVCDFLFHPSAAEQPGFDPEPAVAFWDEVNRQDWRVCELSQQGVASRSYEPAPYSNLESMVAAFDQCYLERLATGNNRG
ncbi:MAG: aromatic ring-hydroxylating dioxygenase subunit alpha, partial [Planctomycetes bacterium]|nr:aromatic ring-hydroxylating dioxygenase subunit alpha [Planctomycetota bacterium]